ncbi:MAG: 16S rRNA (adenine(1518)-N(6)/adenine(1519)-N(6))-dimethyltransferase RsmA [Actinomycetes bacterium]|jgi:16S rRNA (adenine1518-N6/adenine1519-N6)-dimethyltransferase|nr:16S rRNA (adenine(1518)-N(6)/adenine(1519)-N(6))-dimethyltransferase RsmA [Actinomycetes bacterium]
MARDLPHPAQYSPLANPAATIRTLQEHSLYTKKRLGQHFLVADGVVGRIMRLAAPSADDVILEIGPGIGTLTTALLSSGAPVVALEKDPDLVQVLTETLGEYETLHLVAADALTLPTLTLPAPPTTLIANLPYAVAATVVLDAFQSLATLRSATVMVQREVACRMAARPGTKDYGAYTVKLRLLTDVAGSFSVSRSSFLPPPRVDSTVIRLIRIPPATSSPTADASKHLPTAYAHTAAIVDCAFAMRRKTLYNNLRATYPTDTVTTALHKAGVSASARAETLTPADFVRLAAELPTSP